MKIFCCIKQIGYLTEKRKSGGRRFEVDWKERMDLDLNTGSGKYLKHLFYFFFLEKKWKQEPYLQPSTKDEAKNYFCMNMQVPNAI